MTPRPRPVWSSAAAIYPWVTHHSSQSRICWEFNCFMLLRFLFFYNNYIERIEWTLNEAFSRKKNHTCLVKTHLCGIHHSTRRPWSGWIKAHMCGKNHCQFVFLRSGKNQTCVAFIKHIPNTNVCGKSHTCVLKDKHVCLFPYKRWYFLYLQLYFVFFKRIYYIISPSVISEVTMQCQKSETSSNQPWKKSPVWEFPHMCGKNHTG